MDGIFGGSNNLTGDENDVERNGEINFPKTKRKRKKLLLIELLYEYAKNSTLHGLRYIVEKGLHLFERGFWFVTFLMSLALCFALITNVWTKWKTSPVIVSFSEAPVPVGDVPFPSITICPELKIRGNYNFSGLDAQYLHMLEQNDSITSNFDDAKWQKLSNINLVCDFMSMVETNLNVTNSSLVEQIIEVAPSVTDVISYLYWRGQPIEVEDGFKMVLTTKGICYNFNALAAEEILNVKSLQKEYIYINTTRKSVDWSPTGTGYTKFNDDAYPRRGLENQARPDLEILVKEPIERDGLCNIFKNGFTIYVQHPMDLPQASLYYYAAIPEQLTSLALKFSRLSTTDTLKHYTSEQRQCYFPEDKHLRYFKIYTSSNCRLECQSNYTYQKCGCVWFHMPHYDSEKICTEKKHYCVTEALEELSKAELKGYKLANVTPCLCLPSCESVQYDAEILKTNLLMKDWNKYLVKQFHYNETELNAVRYAEIEIYFKESRFISMHRSELFGVTDFLANCGGLLGLFLGFSFLSLVEIFYFGTLRFYLRLKKDIRQEKKRDIKKQ